MYYGKFYYKTFGKGKTYMVPVSNNIYQSKYLKSLCKKKGIAPNCRINRKVFKIVIF